MAFRLNGAELAAFGDRTALVSGSACVSYAELCLRAASVFRALRRLEIWPGDPVALLSAARAHDEPIALVGALTSGAVAVPLDAHAPPARLASILHARACRAIVLDEKAISLANSIELELARLAPDGPLPAFVVLNGDGHVMRWERRSEKPFVAPTPAPPGTLACILHTSGSTGVPKAVPITWDGLDAFTNWALNCFEIQSNDRILRVAELIFDLAWFDHLTTFRAGAALITLSRRDLAAGAAFRDALRAQPPTMIYGVPSLFMKLNAALPAGATLTPCPRAILYAGEAFPPSELLAFSKRVPEAALYNLFGPTETNVCTYHPIDRQSLDGVHEIAIGKACPYAHCELRAETSDDEPKGEIIHGPGVGELWVSGPTALGGGPYATRDRVELREDGLYYFRGRIDRMLKIRGYRVEPAEIEMHLARHPQVRQAAVFAAEDPKLGRILKAAVEIRAEDKPGERDLRMFIAENLPAYMVPERIAMVDELPRTSTGKIDYRACLHL